MPCLRGVAFCNACHRFASAAPLFLLKTAYNFSRLGAGFFRISSPLLFCALFRFPHSRFLLLIGNVQQDCRNALHAHIASVSARSLVIGRFGTIRQATCRAEQLSKASSARLALRNATLYIFWRLNPRTANGLGVFAPPSVCRTV